jgi:dTDP-4-amino-4,6-dideoxygalactose transaminase
VKTLSAVLLSAAAILACAAPLAAQAGDPPDISGYWELPIDGRAVPPARLSPAVTPATLEAEARKTAKAIRWCNWVGMPTTMDVGRPLNIRQGAREIVIVADSPVTPVRHLYLNRKTHINADIFDPTTSGDSIAHWEGDTLVVETTGFEPTKGITAIPGGGFRTAASRLVERYRLLKDGTVLSVRFTWTDPSVFQTPHSYEFRYHRVAKGYEPRPYQLCDPFDAERTAFLEQTR